MRTIKALTVCSALQIAAPAFCADGAARPLPPPEPPRSNFVFSLLPKSLQKHPSLDFHVITEMTAEGRKAPAPAADRPVYYVSQAGKFTQQGNNTPGNEHPPSTADLTRAMERALSANGYRPATPSTPLPALVVVFNYGSFARFSTDAYDMQQMIAMEELAQSSDPNSTPGPFIPSGGDRDPEALLPMVLSSAQDRQDVLQRADLVGGEKFARSLAKVLNDEATYRQGHAGTGLAIAGDAGSPFHQFANANATMMNLVAESFSSCYFVVASAYDYVAMKKGHRVLLWRTKMTVNSAGISMSESLPPLIANAGPYFGCDMTDPVILTRKITREGKVEIGEPRVVDYSDPETPPPASPAPAAPNR